MNTKSIARSLSSELVTVISIFQLIPSLTFGADRIVLEKMAAKLSLKSRTMALKIPRGI